MNVAFRTTCTESSGFGHLRRCLTLAEAVARTAQPTFLLTCDERGRALAEGCGFAVELLPPVVAEPATTLQLIDTHAIDALVVDDYAVTSDQLAAFHARTPRLLALDDLADHVLDVDAVLNANPAAATAPYDVPADALRLLGPSFALVRREFRDLPRRTVADEVGRVLVTLGGSNPGGRTDTIARTLLRELPTAIVEVVAGPLFVGDLPVDARLVVHRSPRDMVELMTRADLAVAAGGQTTYELAACGVPTVALCVADNQRANLAALAAVPTLRIASDADVAAIVGELARDRNARQQLASHGQALIDGRGADRAWQLLAQRWSAS